MSILQEGVVSYCQSSRVFRALDSLSIFPLYIWNLDRMKATNPMFTCKLCQIEQRLIARNAVPRHLQFCCKLVVPPHRGREGYLRGITVVGASFPEAYRVSGGGRTSPLWLVWRPCLTLTSIALHRWHSKVYFIRNYVRDPPVLTMGWICYKLCTDWLFSDCSTAL